MKILDEIKQSKFSSIYEEADINILFTANWLSASFHKIMKPYSISPEQFNILRILRGQYPNPAPLKLVTERMLDKMSNTSRLVQKLFDKGMVTRKICDSNRRQVDILITEKGLEVCSEVSNIINDFRLNSRKITEKEAETLSKILDKMRSE